MVSDFWSTRSFLKLMALGFAESQLDTANVR